MAQAALPSPYPKVRIFVYAEAFIFTGTVRPQFTKMEGEEHINGNGRNSSVATVRGEKSMTLEKTTCFGHATCFTRKVPVFRNIQLVLVVLHLPVAHCKGKGVFSCFRLSLFIDRYIRPSTKTGCMVEGV